MDEYNLRENVYDVCEPFLVEACYLYDYGIDFQEVQLTLSLLDAVLKSSSKEYVVACQEVMRAFVCNYVYVGCNPSTSLPQGVCKQDCINYAIEGDCKNAFQRIILLAENFGEGFTFILDCEDPLWNVKIMNPELVNITMDPNSCISLSGKYYLPQVFI